MRWFFILSGVFIIMMAAMALVPSWVWTPAFHLPVLGLPIYWGVLEVIVLTYIGSRVCK